MRKNYHFSMSFFSKRLAVLLCLVALSSVTWAQVNYLRVISTQAAGTRVALLQEGVVSPAPSVEYKLMDADWTTYSYGTNIVLQNVGDSVMFRGNNASFSLSNLNYLHFDFSNQVAVRGNVMTLLDKSGVQTTVPDYAFIYLFSNCPEMIEAPQLLGRDLGEGCYFGMFHSCEGLTTAPVLGASSTGRQSYAYMFKGCTSLTATPAMGASTMGIAACYHMFDGCTSLTTAQNLDAATVAAQSYDNMFKDCTSLTTAPAIHATTLAPDCYNMMFKGCTSLSVAPALPVTTLEDYCYSSMFEDCTNLVSVPALPAMTMKEGCYESMFKNTGIAQAPALVATTLAESCYKDMFYHCSNLVNAPNLPATTLEKGCYEGMFSHCENLSASAKLPATTLAEDCYKEMFYNCVKLHRINVAFTDWSEATSKWVKGVSPTGYFVCNSQLPEVSGVDNIPLGWIRLTQGDIQLAQNTESRTTYFNEDLNGYCPGYAIEMDFQVISGNPAEYQITFDAAALAAGFENFVWKEIPENNQIVFNCPNNCPAGTYTASVEMRNDEGSVTAPMTIYFTINIDSAYTTAIYSDVISIVNKDYEFMTYQWYHNGEAIKGATLPYYQENGGLTGIYYVVVTLYNGETYRTCDFVAPSLPNKKGQMLVYPNPSFGSVSVKVYGEHEAVHQLQVLNNNGAVMMSRSFQGQQANLDLSNLQQGTYMICVDGVMSKVVKL